MKSTRRGFIGSILGGLASVSLLPKLKTEAPPSDAGSYHYKVTFVNADGTETRPVLSHCERRIYRTVAGGNRFVLVGTIPAGIPVTAWTDAVGKAR